MQGGSIGVASDQNVGSAFSFYIKSRRAMPPPKAGSPAGIPPLDTKQTEHSKAQIIQTLNENPQAPLSAKPSAKEMERAKGIEQKHYHILIVEDNLINQRVLSSQLKKLGHTIHVANHGVEALSQLSQTSFSTKAALSPAVPLSVILMDIEMPVMDGLTCTRRIREMEARGELSGHVPIIAVSANARKEQVDMAKSAGVDDAICKPFRIPQLMALVQGLGVQAV